MMLSRNFEVVQCMFQVWCHSQNSIWISKENDHEEIFWMPFPQHRFLPSCNLSNICMYNRNGKISKYCLISRQKISITLNLIMQFSIICLDFLFVVRSENWHHRHSLQPWVKMMLSRNVEVVQCMFQVWCHSQNSIWISKENDHEEIFWKPFPQHRFLPSCNLSNIWHQYNPNWARRERIRRYQVNFRANNKQKIQTNYW
jgi:hypothetical protein